MSVQRYTAPDPRAAAQACAQHSMGILDQELSRSGLATFAFSGGGTARLLFDELLPAGFPWDRVHLFWVDERCVPTADRASNYGVAEEYFIRPAGIPASHVHRIHGELPPDAAAARYDRHIHDFFGLEDGQFPQFDLVHLGMGPDAHTASLFPGDPLLNDRARIAAATFAAKFAQWRVTLLPGALLAARHTVFLVTGADKQDAVRAVFQEEYDPQKYPAQLASQQGRDVAWLLDEAAAGLLD